MPAIIPPVICANGRFCVLDTETSGLGADHRVVELAVIEIIDRRITGREFHTYLNPERSIDAEAERIHGLTGRFLADKPKFRDIHAAFIAFLGEEGQLVAHNAAFDTRMLNAEFGRMGIEYRMDQRFGVIDTMKLARKLHPGQRASLDALCARYQVSRIEREESGRHGALSDARILTRVFLAMTAGQARLGYSDGRAPVAPSAEPLDRRRFPALKIVYATPAEERAHARLCDAIEKSSGGECGFRGQWRRAGALETAPDAHVAPANGSRPISVPAQAPYAPTESAASSGSAGAAASSHMPATVGADLAFVPSI